MSTEPKVPRKRRINASDVQARKDGDPILSLTSYQAHTATIIDRHSEFLLVEDSLGMVMHGNETTIAGRGAVAP